MIDLEVLAWAAYGEGCFARLWAVMVNLKGTLVPVV